MAAPRFLLVRFSAIGDCVMAAWAGTSIRRRYPEAFLCWAIESRCIPIIDRVRLTSQIAEFPRHRWKSRRWSPATWREQIFAYTRLRKLRFDYGIDLQGHSKTALCLRLASPTRRVQARATDRFACKLNPMVGDPPPGTHMVEWNHQVLKTFGDFELPQRPIMPALPVKGDDRLVTLSVGAGHPEKKYPVELWTEVAEGLVSAGYRVAVLGGHNDRPLSAPDVEDQVGKLPLDKTMELIVRSRLHLAADTGSGHIAAAYGIPGISIFGPTDPAVYRPYSESTTVLRNGHDMNSVEPSLVLASAIDALQGSYAARTD